MLLKQMLFHVLVTIFVCLPLAAAQQNKTETFDKVVIDKMWAILKSPYSTTTDKADSQKSEQLQTLFLNSEPTHYIMYKLLNIAISYDFPKVALLSINNGAIVNGEANCQLLNAFVSERIRMIKLLFVHNVNIPAETVLLCIKSGKIPGLSRLSPMISLLTFAGADKINIYDKSVNDYLELSAKEQEIYMKAVAAGEAERKQKIDEYNQEVTIEKRTIYHEIIAAVPDAGWQDMALIIGDYVTPVFFEDHTQAEQRQILFPRKNVS
jgi:hypothetical protein